MRSATPLSQQADDGRHVASGAVTGYGNLIGIDADFASVLGNPSGRGVGLFVGNRETHFGRQRVLYKDGRHLGPVDDFANCSLVRSEISYDPSAAVKIHHRRKQAFTSDWPDNTHR